MRAKGRASEQRLDAFPVLLRTALHPPPLQPIGLVEHVKFAQGTGGIPELKKKGC